MAQNQNPRDWKNDERLKNVDSERIALLTTFAKELAEAPSNQKMAQFLAISQKAAAQTIVFSPEERELMLSVLTENMSPEEKQKVKLIQNLVSKMPRGNK